MLLEEYINLKDGDKIVHKHAPFMPHTYLREAEVFISPSHGSYGEPNGEFKVIGEVSRECKGCDHETERIEMTITMAQALIFWKKVEAPTRNL